MTNDDTCYRSGGDGAEVIASHNLLIPITVVTQKDALPEAIFGLLTKPKQPATAETCKESVEV